jgi:hypothetical protein
MRRITIDVLPHTSIVPSTPDSMNISSGKSDGFDRRCWWVAVVRNRHENMAVTGSGSPNRGVPPTHDGFMPLPKVCRRSPVPFDVRLLRRPVEVRVAKIREIQIGAPGDKATKMAPLATRRQVDHFQGVVAASFAAGARPAIGRRVSTGNASNYVYEPTILFCGGNDVACACEVLFGPVLSVIPFDDEADVIAKANYTRNGMTASRIAPSATLAKADIESRPWAAAGLPWSQS